MLYTFFGFETNLAKQTVNRQQHLTSYINELANIETKFPPLLNPKPQCIYTHLIILAYRYAVVTLVL